MFGGRIGDQEVGEVQCETLAERSRERVAACLTVACRRHHE